jgi:hypothetical protein
MLLAKPGFIVMELVECFEPHSIPDGIPEAVAFRHIGKIFMQATNPDSSSFPGPTVFVVDQI